MGETEKNTCSKEEVLQKIEELEKLKKEVKGTKCEVWSRVVGYLRPVQNYNSGKKEEYSLRKKFNIENK